MIYDFANCREDSISASRQDCHQKKLGKSKYDIFERFFGIQEMQTTLYKIL